MIKKVEIKPGCIGCHACENNCASVFRVRGTSKVVSDEYGSNEKNIEKAARECPVNVIYVEYDDGHSNIQEIPAVLSRFISKKKLARDVYEFSFNVGKFNYEPGQFVSLRFKDGKGEFSRAYSIAGYENGVLKFCIKILKNGRGGRCLMKLSKDNKVEILGPKGEFVLKKTKKNKIFIATGTGLAPIIEMVKASPDMKKTVLFGVRDDGDLFYVDRLRENEGVDLMITLSKAGDGWEGLRGRVTDHLNKLDLKRSEIYICGNPHMIEAVTVKLREMGVENKDIITEKFVLAGVSEKLGGILGFVGRLVFDGDIPYFDDIRLLVWYSSWSVPLGLIFFADSFRDLGSFGWNILLGVMFIRPLADVFPDIKLFRKLVVMRKEFGVLSAVLVLGHSVGYFLNAKLSIWSEITTNSVFWDVNNYLSWGLWGALVAVVLMSTSNRLSMKIMGKWWKRLQQGAYLFLLFGAIHVFMIQGDFFEVVFPVIVIVVFWLLAKFGVAIAVPNFLKNLFNK